MTKLKFFTATLLVVFVLGATSSYACDKTKTSSNKSSCNTEIKTVSNEKCDSKTISVKEDKGECTSNSSCSTSKSINSTKASKSSCCPSGKNVKMEAKNGSKDIKTVAENPSK